MNYIHAQTVCARCRNSIGDKTAETSGNPSHQVERCATLARLLVFVDEVIRDNIDVQHLE